MQYLYLWLNIFSILGPLALSFDTRVAFYKNWKALFLAIGAMMLVFIPWDVAFEVNGIWGFNDDYLCGIRIFHLPIEEWLFFITVPYACVFIYECVKYYLPDILKSIAKPFFIFLAAFLLVIALINFDRNYTFFNFAGASILLFVTLFWIKPVYLGRFLLSFIIALVPFLLVNGVLTGTGIEDQIVWYNSADILGFRIITIPIEDTVYCLFMLLLTVVVYERLKIYFHR
jgi:lycopene cyclase domain-containing protein